MLVYERDVSAVVSVEYSIMISTHLSRCQWSLQVLEGGLFLEQWEWLVLLVDLPVGRSV